MQSGNTVGSLFAPWYDRLVGLPDNSAILTAETAIDRLYADCGKERPAIVWCRSLYQLVMLPSLLFAIFHSDLWQEISGLFRDSVECEDQWRQEWDAACWDIWLDCGAPILRGMNATSLTGREYGYLEAELIAQVLFALRRNLRLDRLHAVEKSLKREIYRKFWLTGTRQDFAGTHVHQVELAVMSIAQSLLLKAPDAIRDQYQQGKQYGAAMREGFVSLVQRLGAEPSLQIQSAVFMADNVSFLSVVKMCQDSLRASEYSYLNEGIEIWHHLAQATCATVCLDGIAFLLERPLDCCLNGSLRLHAHDRPALSYSDGFEQYMWNGVAVSRQIVCEPESITVAQIESESNIELRRVMLERFGEARYLKLSGMRPVQEDEFGVLFRKEFENDEPLVMVKVRNATAEPDGSVRDYFLRVPPDTTTAHQGVAWTFGFIHDHEHEYAPSVET